MRRPNTKWTESDDTKLVELVNKYGQKNWTQIAKLMRGQRLGKQCRERWRNQLDPAIIRTPFTQEDDEFVLKRVREIGTRWAQLAGEMPGRTENAIKNRFYGCLSTEVGLPTKKRNSKRRASSMTSSSTSPVLLKRNLPRRSRKAVVYCKDEADTDTEHDEDSQADASSTPASSPTPCHTPARPAPSPSTPPQQHLRVDDLNLVHASPVPPKKRRVEYQRRTQRQLQQRQLQQRQQDNQSLPQQGEESNSHPQPLPPLQLNNKDNTRPSISHHQTIGNFTPIDATLPEPSRFLVAEPSCFGTFEPQAPTEKGFDATNKFLEAARANPESLPAFGQVVLLAEGATTFDFSPDEKLAAAALSSLTRATMTTEITTE